MCALSRTDTLRKFNNRTFQTEHMLTAVFILSKFLWKQGIFEEEGDKQLVFIAFIFFSKLLAML